MAYARLIGDMYARWTLDCVVEIAYAVSKDFILRPEFYKAGDVPDNIITFRIEYGNSAEFPNQAQRQEMNSPVLGASDGYQLESVPLVSGTPPRTEFRLTNSARYENHCSMRAALFPNAPSRMQLWPCGKPFFQR